MTQAPITLPAASPPREDFIRSVARGTENTVVQKPL
jgi:hypothetical protein